MKPECGKCRFVKYCKEWIENPCTWEYYVKRPDELLLKIKKTEIEI